MIPLQVKLAIAAALLALIGGMSYTIKVLHAKATISEARVTELEDIASGWDNAYTNLLQQYAASGKVVVRVQKEKEAADKAVGELQRKLRGVSANDKCAQTDVPDDYVRTLVDGLPSRRKATTGAPATGDPSGAAGSDGVP